MKSQFQIMALGEILWDLFPDRSCFGGAPANYACAAAELGGDEVAVQMFSGVGSDDLGDRALQELALHGVDCQLVQRREQPTGTVNIELNDDGSARYEFAADVAWDNLNWNEELIGFVRRADAICFGTLAQRSRQSAETIQKLVQESNPEGLRIFDINLRFPHVVDEIILPSLELCNVLKLNDEELPYLARLLAMNGSEDELASQLSERFELELVALTQGAKGACLYQGSNKSQFHVVPDHVVDTVGAGDAFTAALTLKWLQLFHPVDAEASRSDTNQLQELVEYATGVAAFVCTQPGATPSFDSELF